MDDRQREAMAHVLTDIGAERMRQHEKWGVQRHDFPVWITVLAEEVGELSQATLRRRSVERKYDAAGGDIGDLGLHWMRAEAVQVAAVAVALIEHIDELSATITPTSDQSSRSE